jgi:hypothetical protein
MYNEKKFRALYSDYLESGLTIRAYCSNHGINEAKFYYWKKKISGHPDPVNGFFPLVFGTGKPARSSHVPVLTGSDRGQFTNPAAPQNVSCEINYPNGVCIKLNGLSDMEGLRSLLQLYSRDV